MNIEITSNKKVIGVVKVPDETGMIFIEKKEFSDELEYFLNCYNSSSCFTPYYVELKNYYDGLTYNEIETLFYLCSTIVNDKKYDLIDCGWKIEKAEINYLISHPKCSGNSFFRVDYGFFNYDSVINLYNTLGWFLDKFEKKDSFLKKMKKIFLKYKRNKI
jgi:hypothetical protein